MHTTLRCLCILVWCELYTDSLLTFKVIRCGTEELENTNILSESSLSTNIVPLPLLLMLDDQQTGPSSQSNSI